MVTRHERSGEVEAVDPPQADLIAIATALIGALGACLTAAISLQTVYATHLARLRRFEDKFGSDAAAAVAAVSADYVGPIRRERLAALLDSEAIEHSRPGLDEIQHLARLFTRWTLSLKLSECEAEEAFERAVSTLAEDYQSADVTALQHEVRKALSLSKSSQPSTILHLTDFISKTRPGSITLTRGTDGPMSRLTTPS